MGCEWGFWRSWWAPEVTAAMGAGDYDTAYKALTAALEHEAVWDNANVLNSLTWNMVDPDADVSDRNPKLAVKMAERAAELTEGKSAPVLDTLAWAYYQAGMKDKAIATETKAIALLSGDAKASYVEALERMKK